MTTGNTWNISWNLTGSGLGLDGLLIKSGNVQGSGMLYRFYGVSANEKVIGSGTVTFDNPVKNISHISFFGSPIAYPQCPRRRHNGNVTRRRSERPWGGTPLFKELSLKVSQH